MNRDEALEIIETISEVYPLFKMTERKVSILLPELEKMDYGRVKARLSEYMTTNPYPPTLADIAAYAPEKNDTLSQVKKWEREAEKVPRHVKEQFRKKMLNLIKDKNK